MNRVNYYLKVWKEFDERMKAKDIPLRDHDRLASKIIEGGCKLFVLPVQQKKRTRGL